MGVIIMQPAARLRQRVIAIPAQSTNQSNTYELPHLAAISCHHALRSILALCAVGRLLVARPREGQPVPMKPPLYDSHCHDLAEYFLSDCPNNMLTKENLAELATAIQAAVEDWFLIKDQTKEAKA